MSYATSWGYDTGNEFGKYEDGDDGWAGPSAPAHNAFAINVTLSAAARAVVDNGEVHVYKFASDYDPETSSILASRCINERCLDRLACPWANRP